METFMEVNKETAHRLWVQQFGKKQKAVDFAGREIAKAAYNDRNSDFGWNVDHIYPESKGGKTADYNLICCHILTNDEKADKSSFTANGKKFEIQKKQNHYEIVLCSDAPKEIPKVNDVVNFLDSAQGIDFWKHRTANQKEAFVGFVKIQLEVSNDKTSFLNRFENFLIELFKTKSIFAEKGYSYNYYSSKYCFTVVVYDLDQKKYVENLLDDCIILNTYRKYFVARKMIDSLQIVCGLKCYKSNFEMSMNILDDIITKKYEFIDVLAIDELLKINTTANKKLDNSQERYGLYPYNYVFTELDKNLSK